MLCAVEVLASVSSLQKLTDEQRLGTGSPWPCSPEGASTHVCVTDVVLQSQAAAGEQTQESLQ